MFLECDGIILGTNPSYEGPAIDAWKEWFGNRPVMFVGPMSLMQTPVTSETEQPSSDVIVFLDKALKDFGSNSVVYVSASLHQKGFV